MTRDEPHSHDWIDVTSLGDHMQQLYCAQCGQQAQRRFSDVNISTQEDDARHVAVIMRNDGTGNTIELPYPMELRPLPAPIVEKLR